MTEEHSLIPRTLLCKGLLNQDSTVIKSTEDSFY